MPQNQAAFRFGCGDLSNFFLGIPHRADRTSHFAHPGELPNMATEEAKVVDAVPPPPAYYKLFSPGAAIGAGLLPVK